MASRFPAKNTNPSKPYSEHATDPLSSALKISSEFELLKSHLSNGECPLSKRHSFHIITYETNTVPP